ncbi:MAG TPA: PKD domain-containing protein [Flavobacteriales bacterium]|nr:PKD domain-containing protein [Flavobacteriales bacterium]
MSKHLTSLILLFALLTAFNLDGTGQNLVPNWDFETYAPCPSATSQLSLAIPWSSPSNGTPDYYNACAPPGNVNVPNAGLGYQQARSGVGFGGMILYEDLSFFGPCPDPGSGSEYREYLEVQLTSPLVGGVTYCVEMYVNLPNTCRYQTEDFGIYFSNTYVFMGTAVALPFSPQFVNPAGAIADTTDWVQVAGTYLATGGEEYILIGNFKDDASTNVGCFDPMALIPYAYYFIDDVCISPDSVCCSNPCNLTISTAPTNVMCNGSCDGWALATPSNGNPPFTYLWDSNAANQATAAATGLCAGSYDVTVTDVNGCVATVSVNITEPGALGVTTSFIAVSCNGASDGTATATPNGGASPYQYLWSNGQQTSTATGLVAGSYTVTVTDNNACTSSASVTVTEPAGMGASITNIPETCGASDGSATVSLSGGTGPFTYLWSNGQTGSTDTVLAAGAYTVTVTDAFGCTTSISTVVNGVGGATLSMDSTTISCNGGTDGTITVTASGGSVPYTYLWNDLTAQTNSIAIGLGAGSYTVTVTDFSGCISISSVTLTEPTAISLSLSSTPATCGFADGTASVTASGGSGSYTYLWSPSGGTASIAAALAAGTYVIVVTDSAGCSITDSIVVSNTGGPVSAISNSTDASCFTGNDGSASVTVIGGTSPLTYSWSPSGGTNTTALALAPGSYTVTVTDAGGCISTSSVIISSPPDILLTLNSSMISCAGNADGSVVVTVSGGTGTYTYLWSPTGDTGPNSTNLDVGTYSVLVTDANGCSKTDTVIITEPDTIVLNLSSIPASCGVSDGSAIVSASGGMGSYTYAWAPSGSTNDTASGIAVGVYTVTVTDGNNCSVIDSVIVNNSGGQTASLLSSTNASCAGDADGTATVTVSGGTTPYTYEWSTAPTQSNALATGLSAGSYNCTITDAGACIAIVSVNITEPDSIMVSITPDTIVCPGEIVTISASATGGTEPYNYAWDNLGAGSVHTIAITQDTTFTVNVIDANLCSGNSAAISISVGPPLSVVALGTNIICNTDSTPISATGVGGFPPYLYTWDQGLGAGQSFWVSPLVSTTYTVTYTDSCGTTATDSVLITVTPDLILNPTSTSICPGQSDTLYATGGANYWWINETTLDTFSTDSFIIIDPTNSTNYIIYATDSNGCDNQDTAVVTVNNDLTAAFIADPEIATMSAPIFQFTDLSMGNPVSWYWTFGDSSSADTIQHPTHTYTDTGVYQVMLTVTDINGCVNTTYFTVSVKEIYMLFAPNTFTPDGDGINDYFLPVGLGIDEASFQMYIYNRWGDMIYKTEGIYGDYETTAPIVGWNGIGNYGERTAQKDVYIWMIKTEDSDRAKHLYVGHVTLLK